MNEQEFETMIRKALRQPQWWDEITAQESDATEVLGVLRKWSDQVKTDLKLSRLKLAEAEANRAIGGIRDGDFKRLRHEQLAWRRKAEGFQAVLTVRIDELTKRLNVQTERVRNAATHQEHAQKRAQYRQNLRLLAAAIYLHQSEEITDADLYSLLDNVTLPINDRGSHEYYDLTLRQAIDKDKLSDALNGVRAMVGRQVGP
ncbi:MAG TPA: hypothetical protein VFR23_25305 [Jiangellaceae bacterium]|nr:hypothetical protein [Jiangellaceae bacterium]